MGKLIYTHTTLDYLNHKEVSIKIDETQKVTNKQNYFVVEEIERG